MASKLEKIDKEAFDKVISSSSSLSDILKAFGLTCKGTGNFNTLRRILKDRGYNVDLIKEKGEKERLKKLGKLHKKNKIPLKNILVESSSYNRGHLKSRLLKEGILENKCIECGQLPEWNGKPLTLQLDHKNGISNDNRLENLRIICPHCHSQTKTFAGRKHKKEHFCSECGEKKKTKESQICKSCNLTKPSQRKVKNRPSKRELKNMIDTMPWVAIGRKYNVSDNAVRKWARSYKLI
jgi:5-methylcytosine-specific restriction endonuclease McrA